MNPIIKYLYYCCLSGKDIDWEYEEYHPGLRNIKWADRINAAHFWHKYRLDKTK